MAAASGHLRRMHPRASLPPTAPRNATQPDRAPHRPRPAPRPSVCAGRPTPAASPRPPQPRNHPFVRPSRSARRSYPSGFSCSGAYVLGSAEAPCTEADSPRVNGAANTCRGYSGGLVTVTVGSDVADPGDAGAYIEPTETYRWRLLAINEQRPIPSSPCSA